MANKVLTLQQAFDTTGGQPDLSAITYNIHGVLFIPENANAMEVNGDPSSYQWIDLGTGKEYNVPMEKSDMPSFRAKSGSEVLNIHLEVEIY